ncbi:MAG: cadherin domain-containing protein, partial [Opitutales bacterium]
LSNVFNDIDDDNASIVKTAVSSDPSLVEASVEGEDLTLYYHGDKNGNAVVTVTAISNGQDANDTFTVTVGGVNDTPTFAEANATFSVPENNASSFFFTGTDVEEDFLSYSLSGPDSGLFNFNEVTGELNFQQSPDFEANASAAGNNTYDVTITVSDGETNATQSVIIEVTNLIEDLDGDGVEDFYDLDDDGDGFPDGVEIAYGSDPMDAASVANAAPDNIDLNGSTIAENQPVGALVGHFHASDPDVNASHVFAFADGNGSVDNHLFALDANGSLTTQATFDFESNATALSILIRATDEHNASISQAFVIEVTNLIEDLDDDGIEDFFDLDDDGDGFPDEEEIAAGTDPEDADSVPNLPPTAITLEGNQISENMPAGSEVGQLRVTDPDDPEGTGAYLLEVLGPDENATLLFQVDEEGRLVTSEPLDFEQMDLYEITVKATDVGGLSLEERFNIQVLDLEGPRAGSITLEQEDGIYFATAATHAPQLSPVLERGVIVSDHANAQPEESGTRIIEAPLDGSSFTVEVTGLTQGQKQYLRAYAISGEGTYFGRSLAFIPQGDSAEQSRNPFAGAEILDGGWVDGDWFGAVYPTTRGWVYHHKLGWLFPTSDGEDGLWIWETRHGWPWTREGAYPYLYRHNDATWLYYIGVYSGFQCFFNWDTRTLETYPVQFGSAAQSGQDSGGEEEQAIDEPSEQGAEQNQESAGETEEEQEDEIHLDGEAHDTLSQESDQDQDQVQEPDQDQGEESDQGQEPDQDQGEQ